MRIRPENKNENKTSLVYNGLLHFSIYNSFLFFCS